MDRKIYLWGDSIGKGVVYSTERNRYCLAKERCTNVLADAGVEIENHAQMGATICAGYADFTATAVEPGSVAVIEFGGNDCDLDWQAVASQPDVFHDGKTPMADFRELLRLFIRGARQRGMSPLLVTPPPLYAKRYFAWVSRGLDAAAIARYLGDVEHIYRWQERYAQAIREIAAQEQCPLLDLRETFLDQRDFPSLICRDGIHPNEDGQRLMAHAVLSCLADYATLLEA